MILCVERGIEEKLFAMLWLVSYLYLLRVPSEVHLYILSYVMRSHSACFLGFADDERRY